MISTVAARLRILVVTVAAMTLAMVGVIGSSTPAAATVGVDWTTRTSAADNTWNSVTYGNGLFVAVSSTGTGNRVMTSPDGITWTSRTSAADNSWNSVAYGNGLFVAVSATGTGNRVMTSPDGITWTSRTSAADNTWLEVTYGQLTPTSGLFVAVSADGTNRVMTSPDGITWTSRTAVSIYWLSVTYGNGLFVAVARTGQVMTSPDGITWTSRTPAALNRWQSVIYGNELFVAVSSAGSASRVMTSPDGITWTSRTPASDNLWQSVTYGNGLFAAVSSTGTTNRVMTSPDGITWTSRTPAAENSWQSVTYGNGLFVAVSTSGTGTRVMTSNSALLTQAGATADHMTIVPPSGTAPANYVIHYNTQARIDSSSAWGVWARAWPVATTDIDLATYQAASSCPASPTVCFRPAAIGTQGAGTSMVYRIMTWDTGVTPNRWMQSQPVTITRPAAALALTRPVGAVGRRRL